MDDEFIMGEMNSDQFTVGVMSPYPEGKVGNAWVGSAGMRPAVTRLMATVARMT